MVLLHYPLAMAEWKMTFVQADSVSCRNIPITLAVQRIHKTFLVIITVG